MIVIFSIALLNVLFIYILGRRLFALKFGILRNKGTVFTTNNTVFKICGNGKLYVHCTGGKFADQFVMRAYPEQIDMNAMLKGQNTPCGKLNDKGWRLFSVVKKHTDRSLTLSNTVVGNFVLNASAQKRFFIFLTKNFPNSECRQDTQ